MQKAKMQKINCMLQNYRPSRDVENHININNNRGVSLENSIILKCYVKVMTANNWMKKSHWDTC